MSKILKKRVVLKRSFARLGEYDTFSFTDGKHEDINIVKTMAHEGWSMDLLINDIAVLKLEKDVGFTGTKITEKKFSLDLCEQC